MKKIIIVAAAAAVLLTGCTVEFTTGSTATPEPTPDTSYQEWTPPPPATPTPSAEKGITVDASIEGTRDEAAAVLQGWDPSFQKPPIVFYDDHLEANGQTFEPDTAAWYDGKIYLDPDTIYDYNTAGNLYYTIGHEMGHGWEEHYDPYYPVSRESELYADCMAGAIAVGAGWDVDALVDYSRYDLGEDDLHGDGEDRYDAMMIGITDGHESCTH